LFNADPLKYFIGQYLSGYEYNSEQNCSNGSAMQKQGKRKAVKALTAKESVKETWYCADISLHGMSGIANPLKGIWTRLH
jgi:hypothetical protein